MGLWDKIKDKYKEVDERLGGYLPGGQTPAEARAPPRTTAPPILGRMPGYPALTPTPSLTPQPVSAPSRTTAPPILGRIPGSPALTPQPSLTPRSRPGRSYQSGPTNEAAAALPPSMVKFMSDVSKRTQDPSIMGGQSMTGTGSGGLPPSEGYPINPDTGQSFTMEEAPYGLRTVSGTSDETQGWRAATKDEGGVKSEWFGKTLDMLSMHPGSMIAGKGIGFGWRLVPKGWKKIPGSQSIKAAIDESRIMNHLSNAEKEGGKIITNGLVKIGDVLHIGGKPIKNTPRTNMVNKDLINMAKEVSPNNYQKILGFLKDHSGKIITSASLSELISTNLMYDNIDRLGIGADKVEANGDRDGANYLRDLQEEAGEFAKKLSSYIPFIQIPGAAYHFIEDSLTTSRLKRESGEAQLAKEQAKNDLSMSYVDMAEGMSSEEIVNDPDIKEFVDDPENWMYKINDVYDDAKEDLKHEDWKEEESKTEEVVKEGKDYDRVEDRRLAEYANSMSDEQFINDPTIVAWVSDSKNDYSTTFKLYQQAYGRYIGGRGIDRGVTPGTPDEPDTKVAPSTLSWGLLGGASQTIKGEKGTPSVPGTGTPIPPPDKVVAREHDRLEKPEQAPTTKTGNPVNTYDPDTGVYTDENGLGHSMDKAPFGAIII